MQLQTISPQADPHSLRTCEPSTFKNAMRRLLGGVTLVCTTSNETRFGMTATAVCSVSADPPMLLVCLNRAGLTSAGISASGILSVNLLCPSDIDLARRFAANAPSGDDRFESGGWTRLETGAPILAGSAASFDCEVVETVDAGSHRIFISRVLAVGLESPGTTLGYFDGQFVLPQPALI